MGRKMSFMGQCTTFLIIWNDKKTVFALARLVLAFGPFLGFFWPSEGQNNPKNCFDPPGQELSLKIGTNFETKSQAHICF